MSVPPKVPEKEPRYKIVELKLTGEPPRQIVFDFAADYFALIESSPDLNTDNVRIAFNEQNNYIPLSKSTLVRAPSSVLKSVWVDWDSSENGKYVKFYYSVVTNIDVPIYTRASETTLLSISSKLDRFNFTSDGLLKVTAVSTEIPNIDVALSTRASETTVSAIKSKIDNLTFDSSNNLKVNASVVSNPPNLDVALSTIHYPVYSQTIGADETTTQSITLDTRGKILLEVYANSDASTTFHLDVSTDNTNWILDYKTYTGTLVQDTLWNGFRYVRLRSDAAGVSGNKVTLILSAK